VPPSRAALLDGVPEGRSVSADEVAGLARRAGRVLVVLDDDPTGSQSVANLPVLLDWTADSLRWALELGAPAVYVMTNSRSLSATDARRRTEEVAQAALAAAELLGVRVDFVSRSDSTLRGHFPLETDALAQVVRFATGRQPDGIVLVPAFPDAGRITVDSVHYAGSAGGYTPVGRTEFAADATFGYASSDLRDWVVEKGAGRYRPGDIARVGLTTLRTDPGGTERILRGLTDAQPVVVDVVEEDDLLRLAVALYAAEDQGSRLLYRVGPPFVRALIGQSAPAPLTEQDVARIRADGPAEVAAGGLVVVGSHVSVTTEQLDRLVGRRHPRELELDVPALLAGGGERQVRSLADAAVDALGTGTVVLRTSRVLVRGADADGSLAIARRVSAAMVEVVRRVVAARRPRFVVAKGGITSSDVAARGLSIGRAVVRGPMLPGIVSLWEPVDGPARGVPFVVFAGNVGGPDALADVVDTLSA
jgi:uncharacterized protein YgbK (DUF1537 family)